MNMNTAVLNLTLHQYRTGIVGKNDGAKALLLLAAAIISAGEKLKMPGVLPLLVNGDRVEHKEITVETTLMY